MTTDLDSMDPDKVSLSRLQKITTLIEDGLLTVILLSMIVLAASQIIFRNIFDSSLFFGDPLLRSMVLWVGLLGAMVASRKNRHINIDIFGRYLPTQARAVSKLITDLFTVIVCTVVAFHSMRFVQMDMEEGVKAFSEVPAWVLELILPVGFVFIGLCYMASFVNTLLSLVRNRH